MSRDARVTHANRLAQALVGWPRIVGTEPRLWMSCINPRTPTGRPIPIEDLPPLRALGGERVRAVPIVARLAGGDVLLDVSAQPLAGEKGALVMLVPVNERALRRRPGR